ncbi:MAG TPA: flagellar motor switch protein FliN [Pirellulales bacterium]|jgi:flagellar motor switch protein FliN/FliY|nr:flagellar motor switch protein FliN [Pirellulales bacterium]
MAADSINQDEINRLLAGAVPPPSAPPAAGASPGSGPAEQAAQADVEALLKQALEGAVQPKVAAPNANPASASSVAGDLNMAPGDVEYLLRQAELALASVDDPQGLPADLNIKPFQLKDFSGAPASKEVATLALVRDVELDVKIELGRTQMYLDDVLRLHKGSVVPLDKLAGDPVDIFVNGRLIARGEVLVLNDNFCVRVAELVAGETTA